MQTKKNILYVDANGDNRELAKFVIESEGYSVIPANDGQKALEVARDGECAAVILEFRLPGLSGAEVCRNIRENNPIIPIVFFTGSAFPNERNAGIAAGADDYLVKPNDFGRLTKVVIGLIKKVEKLNGRRGRISLQLSFPTELSTQQPFIQKREKSRSPA